VPRLDPFNSTDSPRVISVAIGQWSVAPAPAVLRTLLGSCVGVVLYDRIAKLGGLAHVVLPSARGAPVDHPGKYADTAILGMIMEFEQQLGRKVPMRLTAKLVGGANMFQNHSTENTNSGLNIGQRNQVAIEQILTELRIPVLARDVGGTAGRRLTLDTTSGAVTVKVPGGAEFEI